MRAELELVLCCARTEVNLITAKRISTLLHAEIDYELFLGLALSHRVVPLVYKNLYHAKFGPVPQQVLEDLKRFYLANVYRSLTMSKELMSILKLFAANGIPAIPYKGPVLAISLYGHAALREFDDLDILVAKEDVTNAVDLLISQGYRLQKHFVCSTNRLHFEADLQCHWEYKLRSKNDQVAVELHCLEGGRAYSYPFEFGSFWESGYSERIGNEKVRMIKPESMLLVLCIHGAKHCWARLQWLCDVAELLRASKDLDWEMVIEQASTAKCERILFHGVLLAHDLLDAPLSRELIALGKRDPKVDLLTAQKKRWLTSNSYPYASKKLQIFLYHFRTLKCNKGKIQYFLNQFSYFLPYVPRAIRYTEMEEYRLSLPRSLFFLYYLIRLLKLSTKYSMILLKFYWDVASEKKRRKSLG
ncbi:MAG: nucleotidyltransferase family protein [Desulforhabdus sp.]|jgi:hypothetical protein|nr:nucleotidyltransferase family protein [Desulforhabdus sp.]